MTKWTEEWPTEPGRYWFWGQSDYGMRGLPARLYSVVVHKADRGPVYVADGSFMYRGGGGWGVWCRAVLPEPPYHEGGK